MTPREILDRIVEIVQDITGDDETVLTLDTVAEDVEGWDSLNHIKIILGVEREFNVRFEVEEVSAISNVGSLVNLIVSRL